MIPLKRIHVIVLLFLFALAACPVTAGVVLSTVSFTPEAPLTPGTQQHVVATYAVIPSGSTTFAKSHELQMTTGLSEARWSIQVTQNGHNAAQQSKSGDVAFVNGEILSYTTNNDIGMIVTLDGIVPAGATSPFMVIDLVELDNSGNVVPGSEIRIDQPVAGATPAVPPTVPTHTPQLVTTQPPATATPGFGIVAALGCCLVIGILLRRQQ